MNVKIKTLIQLLFIMSAIAVVLIFTVWVIGVTYEPVDPFPRAERTAKCSNNTSVVLYQRRPAWFVSEAEWFVKQFDQNGKTVRRQALFTLPRWNDSEMHRTPDEFCGNEYWPRAETFVPSNATQLSLDRSGGSVFRIKRGAAKMG